VHFHLSEFSDTQSVLDGIRRIASCNGDTNMTAALRLTTQEVYNTKHGDRPRVPDTVVMIVAGDPDIEIDLLVELQRVKQHGRRIIVVAVSDKVRQRSE